MEVKKAYIEKIKKIFSIFYFININTPPLNNDEERALEEELANANANAHASAPTHLDDDCYTLNFESFTQTMEDDKVEKVTQRVGKRLMQDTSGKGKKVLKKGDRVSEMAVALKEYTAMMKDRFNGKLGKSNSSSDQFTQSAIGVILVHLARQWRC